MYFTGEKKEKTFANTVIRIAYRLRYIEDNDNFLVFIVIVRFPHLVRSFIHLKLFRGIVGQQRWRNARVMASPVHRVIRCCELLQWLLRLFVWMRARWLIHLVRKHRGHLKCSQLQNTSASRSFLTARFKYCERMCHKKNMNTSIPSTVIILEAGERDEKDIKECTNR